MSGTFAGIGTLQFSPDNQYAQYFQNESFNNIETEIGQFTTNSEYVVAKFQVSHTQSSGHDFYCDIRFNDVLIIEMKEDATEVEGYPYLWRLIIPPFTTVNVKIGPNTTGYDYQCNVIGKVGMGPRVGNE